MNETASSIGFSEEIDPSSGARVMLPGGGDVFHGNNPKLSGDIVQNRRPRLPDEGDVFLPPEKSEDMWRVDPLDLTQEGPVEASIDTAQSVGGQDLAVDRRIESIPGQVSADKSPGEAGADDAMSISELLDKKSLSTPPVVGSIGEVGESLLVPKEVEAKDLLDIDGLRRESEEINNELEYKIKDTEERFEKIQGDIASEIKGAPEKSSVVEDVHDFASQGLLEREREDKETSSLMESTLSIKGQLREAVEEAVEISSKAATALMESQRKKEEAVRELEKEENEIDEWREEEIKKIDDNIAKKRQMIEEKKAEIEKEYELKTQELNDILATTREITRYRVA